MANLPTEYAFEDGGTFVSPCSPAPDPPAAAWSQVFLGSATLAFPQSGRTYLVTVSWNASQGQFLLTGPLTQKPTASQNSMWTREDSRTGSTSITWEIYIPTATNYAGLTLTASATAYGLWTLPQGLTPICAWSPPALIV